MRDEWIRTMIVPFPKENLKYKGIPIIKKPTKPKLKDITLAIIDTSTLSKLLEENKD